MSYKKIEETFFKKSWVFREKAYGPFLKILHRWRVTADHITYLRALLFIGVVLYPLFVLGSIFWATVGYFGVFWMLDTVDGQLARHTKTESDKGKFNDTVVDVIGYSLYVMGLAFVGVAGVFIMFYHVIIHATDYLMAIVYRNENRESDWVIRAEANLSYLKIIAHSVIVIFILIGRNFVDPLFMLLNIIMTMQAIHFFIKIQKQTFKRH